MYVDWHTKRPGYKMKVFNVFIPAVCVIFLIKLRRMAEDQEFI